MGLLDSFTNLNPDQTQGLLAAAAQILQQSGPSRTPTSLGQVLAGGLGAYQQSTDAARKRTIEEARAEQIAQIGAQALEAGQLDIEGRRRAAQQDQLLQSAYAEAGNDPQKLVEAVSRVDPVKGFQLRQQLAKSTEFDTKPQVGVDANGQPFTYILGKDGTQKRLDGTLPRDELKLANLGGKEVAYNPFVLQPGQSFQRTQTPDGAASNAIARENLGISRERLALDRETAQQRAAMEKAPTEFQGKSAAYGLRAREADKILTGLQGQYSPAAINSKMQVAEWPLVGGALGAATNKFALSDTDQRAEQSQRDFINAVLRQESGAAIGAGEFDNARKQYFPQPGDTKETVAQKAQNRQLAIQGLDSNAGRARLEAPDSSAPAAAKSKIVKLDGGGSATATLGTDGNYYVKRGGKTYRVEE